MKMAWLFGRFGQAAEDRMPRHRSEESCERAGHIAVATANEHRLDIPFALVERADRNFAVAPDRSDHRAGQQGRSEASGDAAEYGFQRAELQYARLRRAVPDQQILEALPIGAAPAQHDDAQVRIPGQLADRR